jgi:hypothetical protein
VRFALLHNERTVRELVERRVVPELSARPWVDPLAVELRVDRVRSDLARVQLAPDPGEAVEVLAAAEGARAVAGREGSCLVEEEELGKAAGLEEWPALPAAELELAGNPALAVVAPADATGRIVEAAPVSVDQSTRRVRDQLTERRDPVLQRHPGASLVGRAGRTARPTRTPSSR